MPRKLTAATAVLLALAFAGCGSKDSATDTTAQSAATTSTPVATTPAATPSKTTGSKASSSKTSTTKASGSKRAGSTTTGAKPSGGSAAATTKAAAKKAAAKKAAAKKAAAKKAAAKKSGATTSTPVVGVTPKGSGANLSSGTGSGPAAERLAVVGVLRSYYKAFLDGDGAQACSLLTSAGREIMIRDGGAKTCAASVKRLIDQAGAQNLELLRTTREGLHIDDITIDGNNATAQIGKTSRLRLVQVDGHWLVRSPNVANGSG